MPLHHFGRESAPRGAPGGGNPRLLWFVEGPGFSTASSPAPERCSWVSHLCCALSLRVWVL